MDKILCNYIYNHFTYQTMKLGVVGNGFVGKASRLLENNNVEVISYDIDPSLCVPKGITLEDIGQCDIVFICVPTPMNIDGSAHLNIVESVVNGLNKVKKETCYIVLRSTVPPGTSNKYKIYFMPEFLTEKNFMYDFANNKVWICGLIGNTQQDELFKNQYRKLIDYAYDAGKILYNEIEWMNNSEAEVVKYYRNTMLAVKVAYCNELNEYCKLHGLNYETIRKVAAADTRIGLSHTQVPGHDGNYGFGGTCFPKDANSLLYEMEHSGMKSYILKSAIERNQNVDRKQKDWEKSKGRCVV